MYDAIVVGARCAGSRRPGAGWVRDQCLPRVKQLPVRGWMSTGRVGFSLSVARQRTMFRC